MATQDIDAFWRSLEAFNRGDLDGYITFCDPDVQAYAISAEAEGDPYRGHEGVRRWWENMELTWGDSLHAEYTDVRDLGDRLLALGRLTGRALSSGIDLDSELGWLGEFRDGRIACWWSFTRHADALDAAGLLDERRQSPANG
jgi:ketosteroid isomerase-like protein